MVISHTLGIEEAAKVLGMHTEHASSVGVETACPPSEDRQTGTVPA